MNRKELIDALADKTGSTKVDADRNIAALIFVTAFLLTGCAGQVREYLDKPDYPTNPDDPGAVGIRVYMSALMKVTSRTTTITDSNTKLPSNDCTPVESTKIEARPDYAKPLRVRFDHGPFDTYTFGVTLSADGILTGINTQSTPPISSVAPLITATVSALSVLKAVAPMPPCTATPEVVKIERCEQRGSVVCEVPR